MKSKYVEGGRRCLTLFLLCFVVYSLVYMTKNMFSSAMAAIVEGGVMTKAETGAISAAFWFVYAVFQIFGGFAADILPSSLLICVGLVGGAASNLVIYFNQSYTVMLIAWMFNAAVQFGVWPSIFRILSVEIEPKHRNSAIFWILFTSAFGSGLSMLIASLVKKWQDNFLLSFYFLIVCLIAWLAIYTPLKSKMIPDRSFDEEKATESVGVSDGGTMRLMLVSGLAVITVISFLRGCTDSAIRMVTPTMLMESYAGLPAAISTRLSIILIVVSPIGYMIGGFIERLAGGNEIKASVILFSAMLLPVILTVLVGAVHYGFVLAFLSVSLILLQSASLFLTSKAAKRFVIYGKSGTMAGIINAALSFANVIASFVFPAVAQISSWRVVTVIWIAATLVSLILSILVYKRWTRFIDAQRD